MAEAHSHPAVRLRSVSVAVLSVLIAASIGAFFGVRSVVASEEHSLLVGRAREAGALLNTALASLPSDLGGLLEAGALDPSGQAFTRAAQPLVAGRGFSYVELLRSDGTVLRSVGPARQAPGAAVTDPVLLAALGSAARSGSLTQTSVFTRGGQRLTGYVDAGQGLAVLAVSAVHPYLGARGNGSAFGELAAVVYDGTHARASQVLFANVRSLALPGSTVQLPVGQGVARVGFRWLLVAAARRPLVGAAALALPWILLAGLLLLALAVTATVEAQSRRRRYALDLVDERTAELRASLAELERTQQQLVQRERLAGIGQLASAVGHELRNPLGVLTNVLFLLRGKVARLAGGQLPEDVARHLDVAEREVGAAGLIVSDLLEFARAREPVLEPVDLPDLVQEALSVAPAPPGVTVSVTTAGELPPLLGDRDQLRQVLLNLLTNAYQAMPDGGGVTLSLAVRGGALDLAVEDEGRGVPPEAVDRLFEPFFTTKPKGVGLGLAVCRRIAVAHGGSLDYEERGTVGACFRLRLPVAAAPAPRPAGDDGDAAGAAAPQPAPDTAASRSGGAR